MNDNVQVLINALKYYADKENYSTKMAWSSDGGQMVTPIEDEKGERARKALEKYHDRLDKTNYNDGR